LEAVAALRDDLAPVLAIEWVDRAMHEQALAAAITSSRRAVSLVDRVSFELMRRIGLEEAFAFDADFEREGFTTLD
jgi:predicted nucleic acid-binding protein